MAIELKGLCPLLQVFDMPASLAFYRDCLGFQVVAKAGEGDDVGWAWLRFGAAELMLNTAYDPGRRPQVPDQLRVAAHADTGLFIGCSELDDIYRHLLSHGVQATPPVTARYGMRQVFTKDPDGYEICFQWPVGEQP